MTSNIFDDESQIELDFNYCKCGNITRSPSQRYCRKCHNKYIREWRPKYNELSDDQKRKSISRSIANEAQKRGKLIKAPCENCGSILNIQKHHDDYDKPLEVKWLCTDCHIKQHKTIEAKLK